MPTFFFDTKDGVTVRDRSGQKFDSREAAIEHSKMLAERLRSKRPSGEPDLRISVIEESGAEIHVETVHPVSAS